MKGREGDSCEEAPRNRQVSAPSYLLDIEGVDRWMKCITRGGVVDRNSERQERVPFLSQNAGVCSIREKGGEERGGLGRNSVCMCVLRFLVALVSVMLCVAGRKERNRERERGKERYVPS